MVLLTHNWQAVEKHKFAEYFKLDLFFLAGKR